MIVLAVNKASVTPDKNDILTSGMVNTVEVEFHFSADWEGLIKTAVFSAGGITKTVAMTDDRCYVPWECLTEAKAKLNIGVCGIGPEGQTVLPTVYCDVGTIRQGVPTTDDPALDPSLPIWALVLAAVGDLSQLETEDKDNLVAAINEAVRTGGGGSSGTTYIPHIGSNGNWFVGETDTGVSAQGPEGEQGPQGSSFNSADLERIDAALAELQSDVGDISTALDAILGV